VVVTITPASLVMPRDVAIEANQSGLISETSIDFTPLKAGAVATTATTPLDRNCDATKIICHDATLKGQVGVSLDELIRTSVKFAEVYSDPSFMGNVNQAVKNTSTAVSGLGTLSQDMSRLTKSLQDEVGNFSNSVKAIGRAADQVSLTAAQMNSLVANNRSNLVTTLDNLRQVSADMRVVMKRLSPFVDEIQQKKVVTNLATFSENAAKASVSLKELTGTAGNPKTLIALFELLNSARATFKNTEKITTDMDEITGDPNFRRNLRNLINNLNKRLAASTQDLEQQTVMAKILAEIQQNRRGATPPLSAHPVSLTPPAPKTSPVRPSPEATPSTLFQVLPAQPTYHLNSQVNLQVLEVSTLPIPQPPDFSGILDLPKDGSQRISLRRYSQ
jgi:phospholipid/cholesterol/gamma-HCH transport system substrate-binding protein